ncbi:hypothetical protein ACI2L1_34590 [Streptomyces sp. NPDC019531]|uniref:hypothetical protein n=1 Tax=Streptomyces sp. NPDC019531 TaxID=3365062 RepID=UPI003850B991
MTLVTSAVGSEAAPRVVKSGMKCSTVGWAQPRPGALLRYRSSSATSPRAGASAAHWSNSADQPGT